MNKSYIQKSYKFFNLFLNNSKSIFYIYNKDGNEIKNGHRRVKTYITP